MPEDIFSKRIAKRLAEKKAYAEKVKVKTQPLRNVYAVGKEKPDESGFTFSVKKGPKEAVGSGSYNPGEGKVKIDFIGDASKLGGGQDLGEMHQDVKGSVMDPGMIKGALEKVKKIYPKAKELVGERVTGAHAQNLFGSGMQKFNLGRMARYAKEVK